MQLFDILESKDSITYLARKEKSCALVLKKWNILEEMASALAIPYKLNISLQKPECTLSDFFGGWILMKIKLSNIAAEQTNRPTCIANKLIISLDKRKNQLFENPAMICAVLLDPRYSSEVIQEEKIRLAKLTLMNLWERHSQFNSKDDSENNNDSSNGTGVDNDTNLLNSYFVRKGLRASALENTSIDESIMTVRINKHRKSADDISEQLDDFLHELAGDFLLVNESTQKFWETKKQIFPELYELAMILYAIPPTQATVERLFSVFGFLYNDWRNQLSQDLLEAMIIITTNGDLFKIINEKDLIEASFAN